MHRTEHVYEEKIELYRQYRAAVEKKTFFFLTAAGACIAFAVQKTEQISMTMGEAPLGLAAALWCFSFFFGCLNLSTIVEAIEIDTSMLDETEVNDLDAKYMQLVRFSKTLSRWQFGSLILGAICFITWRAVQIYEPLHI